MVWTVGELPLAVTANVAAAEAALKVLASPGVKEAKTVTLPGGNSPAGILTVAFPAKSVTGNDAQLPLESVTVPAGVPPEEETVIVAATLCAVETEVAGLRARLTVAVVEATGVDGVVPVVPEPPQPASPKLKATHQQRELVPQAP